jgi:hypothetical protein
MIGITNAGGSGAGCKLTVTAPVGAAITVTNTAGKVKSKTVGANGLAVFRGLTEGKWTITISNSTETASKTVEIKENYSAEITFFSATINIAYPAGLACTVTDGVTTLNAPDTSGTWDCVVTEAGQWTVKLSTGFAEKVTVGASGESHTVNKWYVYKDGDQYTDLTGGWVKQSGTASITFGDNMITIDSKTSTNQPKGRVHTTNSINLSGFTSLKANITIKQYSATVSSASAGVHNSSGKDLASTSTKSNAIVSVDISSIESLSEIHPFFYENAAKANLLQMWLEV